MAKDPAFLFYSTDFFMGTIELSDEQTGQYIRLMCLQHQKGHLSETVMRSVMHGELDSLIMSKFQQDEDGKYYNARLENEISKRRRYSKSRSENRSGEKDMTAENSDCKEHEPDISGTYVEDMSDICSSHDEHMENENEIENRNEIKQPTVEVEAIPRAKNTHGKKQMQGACFSHDDNAYQAAVFLDKQICARLPSQKPSGERRLQAWALEFDRCHRLDGHNWEDIGRVLRFSQKDRFWSANILSGGKFREKYVQLFAKMQVETVPRAGPGNTLDDLQAVYVQFEAEEAGG